MMDELDKGRDVSVKGAAADRAIVKCRQLMDAWGVVPPNVEPLVLDFGLNDFEHVGLIEYWIANEADAGYCGKLLFVLEGQTCPAHRHERKKETFFILKGEVRMDGPEGSRMLRAGDTLPVEPGREHTFTGLRPALLLELSTPCEISDNIFSDPRIPIGQGRAAD